LKEKKIAMYNSLATKNIPRSLRIKVELSTSPSFASNTKFLNLKEKLQYRVTECISSSTKIMTEWAEENIQLLLHECCHTILTKALPLLDGITSYNADVIFMPNWLSTSSKQNTQFTFLIYMSSKVIGEIVNYFELHIDAICLIGAKTLTDNSSDEKAINSMNLLGLHEINLANETEFNFISESLISFDQILRVTTIDLWNNHEENSKQLTAVLKLKSKMETIDTIGATAATASAIAKATKINSDSQSQNLQSKLRISNHKKSLRKQDQKK